MMKETYQVAEVQISYNPKFKAQDRPKINQSEHAYNIFIQQWDKGKIHLLEECKLLLLNRNNRVLGIVNLSQGGISSTILDPRVIFSIALKANASAVVLAHNHPSGNIEPSSADLTYTKRIVECGKLLDIIVADHLIVTEGDYHSLADNSQM